MLIRFDQVSLEYGHVPLLKDADLLIDRGERVCLIGRNGAGKSTLFKLITGVAKPDHGNIERTAALSVALLEQELSIGSDMTVRDAVGVGLAHQRELIEQYEALATAGDDMAALEKIQREIETHGGWELEVRVDQVLTRLGLPADQALNTLSGGWRRRVALGRAIVSKPDLLLLDEPTNHLDIATIRWLEDEIRQFDGAVLFITHDREFMQRVANRILELDLGELTSWEGTYQQFLVAKEQQLADEARHQELFDKKLAAEEVWIRQGIKARRTRNEGRVRALEAMRAERQGRLKRQGTAKVQIATAEESGKKVIQARNITHGFGDSILLEDFDLKVMRGDRIGIVGNNGVGKSTLLRILLGELAPDSGTIKLGTKLEIAYFDQMRAILEPEQTVAQNVGRGRDFVTINGKDKHVISYMADFLFSPERARTPVKALSGGERNRVILAQLFAQPANLLVLDEPTNDLDVEMLEVLEARLVDYEGTLLLVSHDRVFLDNVVTSVLVFEDEGGVQEYVGGYSDWLARGRQLKEVDHPDFESDSTPVDDKPAIQSTTGNKPASQPKKKLSYKLQRELDSLPAKIEQMEQELEQLQTRIGDPSFYSRDAEEVQSALEEVGQLQARLETAIERWGELEEMS